MKFFKDILSEDNGKYSSKRVTGILCVLALVASLVINTYSHGDIKPSDALVQAVSLFAFGALGLTSVDKWTSRGKNKK